MKWQDDWKIATIRQRIAFVFIIWGILIIGGMGIYSAIMFAISSYSNHPDYRYVGFALLFLLLTYPLAKIRIMPTVRSSKEEQK